MTDDTDLIITNDTPGTAATPDKDSPEAPQEAGKPEQTFREALHEQIHEVDRPTARRQTVVSVLGGDFFTAQILRRQIWLFLLIAVFLIVYISNRYSCQKSLIEIENLKHELQDAKYKALSTSSRLTEQSRQSRVLNMLKENRDSVLHIADQPPYIIKVEEEAE